MEQTVLSGFDRAIDFIVPNCPKEAKAQIKNLVIRSIYSKPCHLCILWYRNQEFMKICQQYGIDIGDKEVILSKKIIKATHNFHIAPSVFFEGKLFNA